MKKLIYVLLTVAIVFCFCSCKDEVVTKQLPDFVSQAQLTKASVIFLKLKDAGHITTENVKTYTTTADVVLKPDYGKLKSGSTLTITTIDMDLIYSINAIVDSKSYTFTLSTLSDTLTINGEVYRYEVENLNYFRDFD